MSDLENEELNENELLFKEVIKNFNIVKNSLNEIQEKGINLHEDADYSDIDTIGGAVEYFLINNETRCLNDIATFKAIELIFKFLKYTPPNPDKLMEVLNRLENKIDLNTEKIKSIQDRESSKN